MKRTLADWLAWQETLHPRAIDLGLERVAAVARILDVLPPAPAVITVGGTNGKGSTVAMLEAILLTAGCCVGTYTSPHLVRYNERIRIGGREATDDEICAAFGRIDAARGDVSLTYFEFGTLAALDLFRREGVDVALLEVGMGGRLDAVNIVDADVAVVTNVGLDHTGWLGGDREAIGREKAGIFRAGRPAVCADPDPPASLLAAARDCGAALCLIGRDFHVDRCDEGRWGWRLGDTRHDDLPPPALPGDFQLRNAAAALAALHLCIHGGEERGDRHETRRWSSGDSGKGGRPNERRDEYIPPSAGAASLPRPVSSGRSPFPPPSTAIVDGLERVDLPGRFQRLSTAPEVVVDVAHNPESAAALATLLTVAPVAGHTVAVFAALGDKEIEAIVAPLADRFDGWHVAGLPGVARALPAAELAARIAPLIGAPVVVHVDVEGALAAARARAAPDDRIVVFGSFHTVGIAIARHGHIPAG